MGCKLAQLALRVEGEAEYYVLYLPAEGTDINDSIIPYLSVLGTSITPIWGHTNYICKCIICFNFLCCVLFFAVVSEFCLIYVVLDQYFGFEIGLNITNRGRLAFYFKIWEKGLPQLQLQTNREFTVTIIIYIGYNNNKLLCFL